ncbi:MAG: PH domain-containing protein [Promethearchaeota archaeon]
MSEEELVYEGTISKDYKKKAMLKMFIVLSIFILPSIITTVSLLLAAEIIIPEVYIGLGWYLLIIGTGGVLPYLVILLPYRKYLKAYVHKFSYAISEDKIVIIHGVLTRTRATIPYSRIQNINIVNGVFDRMYKTFTVKIETAGSGPAGAQAGALKPEGYIPGLKDPYMIERKINEMMAKYSQIPSGLEDKIFKPEELAFDNFISYILSKMREGEKLKTNIKTLLTDTGLSEAKLAEQIGVPIETIMYLIDGRYNPSLALAYKIARTLSCKIEELFELN